ncbi:DNA polymerase III subunit delta' [Streptococcus didelphis]|uniref:DNA polymerase III subunit delta n=1 Tax=Streptococcus didelphis TaxID=102886 RepID=A0ABY9LI72_9STRE|nr:DNA polymerase III subunit delta' [Streptococcus didelphis]WMB28539.1 DNA polymerase III subunit delta' [Streptococcus didelphis]
MAQTIAEQVPQAYKSFKEILQKKRLNHAYLFSGDYANLEMALYIAKSIFCDCESDVLACNKCRICQLIDRNEFSDLTILEPNGQFIKTEIVREMMKNFSRTGYESEKQVFIIKDCEKMHTNAANSLLKFIEEPQSSSYIFLLTNDESHVLPTIKSRTQIFHFPKNEAYLVELAQKKGLLKDQAVLMAKLAKNPAHLETMVEDSKILELISLSQRFVSLLLKDKDKAYLEISRLSALAGEKSEQDILLSLLTLILAKDYGQEQAVAYLDALYEARKMWQSNVHFQNALEYMVIR